MYSKCIQLVIDSYLNDKSQSKEDILINSLIVMQKNIWDI